jgi:chromosome segregation ATPase
MEFIMSNQPDEAVHYLPKSFRALHENIMAEIAQTPERSAQKRSEAAGPSLDLSDYLSRVQSASRLLETSSARIRELEALVQDLTGQQAELVAQLEDADRRSAELEQALTAEREHSTRAEGLAAAVASRANELEQAAFDANQKLEALAGAIQGAFGEIPDEIASVSMAA